MIALRGVSGKIEHLHRDTAVGITGLDLIICTAPLINCLPAIEMFRGIVLGQVFLGTAAEAAG